MLPGMLRRKSAVSPKHETRKAGGRSKTGCSPSARRTVSVDRCLAVSLSDDVGDPFRSHLRGVLATRRQLAVIAGVVRFRPAVPGQRDLAAQHHDTHIEVMRVEILAEPACLVAVHDLEALAAQVALERLAPERSPLAAA